MSSRFLGADPASTSAGLVSRIGRRARHWGLVAATALVAAPLVPLGGAQAALGGVGPIDPATNFPAYYTDTNGLSLELCLGLPNCLADTDFVAIHEAGGDAEAFYYAADASTTNFTVHLALEAAYAADGPDQEVVFQRTQFTARDGGLTPGTVYKVTDPYGSYTCTVEADGTISQNACRIETTPVEGDFNRALNGRQGPFLTVDPSEPAPPAGYIGDNATPRKVVGSPTGFNALRVEGPGLTGTCTNADGSTTSSCEQTDRFVLQGKLADLGTPSASLSVGTLDFGDVPTTPAVRKTLTYANTGSVPVTISGVGLTGTAFAIAANSCPVAPATLGVGGRCAVDVTYTPEAGKASSGTLTITDDTPAATRNVALKGSNLGAMYVSDPVPPAGLAFGTVAVGRTSLEDNVVLGNSGNGPLTISTVALTGASAAHYKLGPNNTCRTAVAPDSGCEIGVQFAPTTTGSKTANLRVTDSNGKVVNVPLAGTGGTAAADTTAPTVTTRTPAPVATGVAATTNVTATFSEAVQGVSGTTFFLRRNGTTTNVAATVTYDAASRTATLNPTTDLAAGIGYTATLTGGSSSIRDMAATPNPMATTSWSFTTAPAADTTAPTAGTRVPVANATAVPGANDLTVTFSENVQGVSGTTFVVRAAGSTTNVAGTVSRNGTTNQWILNPTANLANDTRYTVTLSGGPAAIRDLAGNPLASTSWSFTTGPRPTVSTRTPASGATGVGRTANVTASFSENVQAVSGTTFYLRAPGSTTNITATVTRNGTTNQWILNPGVTLAANTRYTATLLGSTTQIRDLAGNPLATTSWSFTTGAS